MPDSEASDSREISISLSKSTLARVGVVLLVLIAAGATYHAYNLTNEVEQLEVENQNKEEKISSLSNQTVQAEYESNKEQIKEDIKRLAGSGASNVEILNMTIKNKLVYAEILANQNGNIQTNELYITLDGEKIFPVRDDAIARSPIDIDSAIERMQNSELVQQAQGSTTQTTK